MKTRLLVAGLIVGAVIAAILGAKLYLEKQEANFPIEVRYRKAITGAGYVVQFVNNSDKSLHVTVEFSNDSKSRSFDLTLDGRAIHEIGYREGWAAASGDKILVKCSGFGSVMRGLP